MKTAILFKLSVVLWCVFFCVPTVEAALITIDIIATVDSVDDQGNYLEGKISVGDTITGYYTYDLLTPDSEPLAYAGLYEHNNPPAGISLNVGGFNFRTDLDNIDFVVAILNDYPPLLKDQFWMRSYNNLPLSNGTTVDGISWQLDDLSGNALSNTDLPTTAPVIDDWEANVLNISGDRKFGIQAHVTSAVPEPATVLLIGLGGLLLRKRN